MSIQLSKTGLLFDNEVDKEALVVDFVQQSDVFMGMVKIKDDDDEDRDDIHEIMRETAALKAVGIMLFGSEELFDAAVNGAWEMKKRLNEERNVDANTDN